MVNIQSTMNIPQVLLLGFACGLLPFQASLHLHMWRVQSTVVHMICDIVFPTHESNIVFCPRARTCVVCGPGGCLRQQAMSPQSIIPTFAVDVRVVRERRQGAGIGKWRRRYGGRVFIVMVRGWCRWVGGAVFLSLVCFRCRRCSAPCLDPSRCDVLLCVPAVNCCCWNCPYYYRCSVLFGLRIPYRSAQAFLFRVCGWVLFPKYRSVLVLGGVPRETWVHVVHTCCCSSLCIFACGHGFFA